MARIISFFTTIRNNWKKTAFAVGVVSYGVSYGQEKYEIRKLMREYCTEAAKYGDLTLPLTAPAHKVLVILNPAANKRKAEENFTDYCEPLLHLAGLTVDIVKTDSDGHARRYVEELQTLPHAIIVAGGDGTLSETITGLFRRSEVNKCPIGILPVGRTNVVASKLFSNSNSSSSFEQVKSMINATISVVRGKIEEKDVMKIEMIANTEEGEESTEEPKNIKPVYAVGSLHWGSFRDVISLRDKYWYTGGLRDYTAFLFNAYSDDVTWHCPAKLYYTEPCSGCKNCHVQQNSVESISKGRWWSSFIPRFGLGAMQKARGPDYSKITNENCSKRIEIDINPSEIVFQTDNITDKQDDTDIPKLNVQIGSQNNYGVDFISESWTRLNQHKVNDIINVKEKLQARTIELIPEKVEQRNGNRDLYYSIDNEAYEVKPIKISLLPKAIQMFTI